MKLKRYVIEIRCKCGKFFNIRSDREEEKHRTCWHCQRQYTVKQPGPVVTVDGQTFDRSRYTVTFEGD